MKKIFSLCCLAASLCCARGFAQDSDINSYSYWDFHPIHLGGNVLRLSGANISDTSLGGRLFYRKTNAFLYMLLPISTKTYFLPQVNWTTFTMEWAKNPKFHQNHFYYAGFSLTFYTTAIDTWR